MKRILVFLAALVSTVCACAQTNPCGLRISGDFDSKCIYDYKGLITDEYPTLMVACKGSTVTYTATADVTVTGYIWEVYGDDTHTASGGNVTVNWGNGEWGMVIVSVVVGPGDTCTAFSRVKLIDNPTAAAATMPAYTVDAAGDYVINVCTGSSVQFVDRSTFGGSDVAGILWSCSTGQQSTTPVFGIDNVTTNLTVTHTVFNNCGCQDQETFAIKVMGGAALELECYGTVCENATVKYSAASPACEEFRWYVEGGTLVSGQGTPNPVVVWDHPENGHGVIGLDGVLCGEEGCPSMMSRRIPVIQDSLDIDGDSALCVGEAAVYTLPLFGSTLYTWSITPATGVDQSMVGNGNAIRLKFNSAGTYKLKAEYECGFLGCGPYTSRELTITVKPGLGIAGQERICVSNACSLSAVPPVTATWKAYSLATGQQVLATATGTTFSSLFPHAGRYLVTAEESGHCGPATFVLTVSDLPPAPTAAELSPDNRHAACPNQGITLTGTPSNPDYNLVWAPACSTAAPAVYSGDSVNITYGAEVCDVNVYNYDRVLGCRSAAGLVHTVSPLAPLPLQIPTAITVCPGSIVTWGSAEVPDQGADGMLYEWSVQSNKQHCASIQGSHMHSGITFRVNEVYPLPMTFYMTLARTYCVDGLKYDTVYVTIADTSAVTLGIDGPASVCAGANATFTAVGGSSSNEAYHWTLDGANAVGVQASHTFNNAGPAVVTLAYNQYTYCTNPAYYNTRSRMVNVIQGPLVQAVVYDSVTHTFSVTPHMPASQYSFEWYFTPAGQPPMPGTTPLSTDSTMAYIADGTYVCVVTDNATGCSSTVSLLHVTPQGCHESMSLGAAYDRCDGTITLTAPNNFHLVTWSVQGVGHVESTSGYYQQQAVVRLTDVGYCTIKATTRLNDCSYTGKKEYLIDFLPHFTLEARCGQMVIHNDSKYIGSGQTVYMTVTEQDELTRPHTVTFGAATGEYYFPSTPLTAGSIKTYTVKLTGYGTDGNITNCEIGTITVENTTNAGTLTITSANTANPTQTCDNTPIMLTASLSPGVINNVGWDFGDNSHLSTYSGTVYHTFASTGYLAYNVTVIIVDENGCPHNNCSPLSITSNNNNMGGTINLFGGMVCPYDTPNPRVIYYSDASYYSYTWRTPSTSPVAGGYSHNTYHPDYYISHVQDIYYCQTEKERYVPFKSRPSAKISTASLACCAGEEVALYGDLGGNPGQYSYLWLVVEPGATIHTYTTPNITFATSAAGVYTFHLTVTDENTTCSSTASVQVTATAPPAAPTLTVTGSGCMTDAPVMITASGNTGTVHWSNGNTGNTAYYYTPGEATAYYDDPTGGCPSAEAHIEIERQPDLDALLTGCYEMCAAQIPSSLPVYSLTYGNQTIDWTWAKNSATVAYGTGSYSSSPLLLPLSGAGIYELDVDYQGGACSEHSDALSLEVGKECNCTGIDVKSVTKSFYMEGCNPYCNVAIEICNNEATDACFGRPKLAESSLGTSIASENMTAAVLHHGDCQTYLITLAVASLTPSCAEIIIYDSCHDCKLPLTVGIMPEIGCEESMTMTFDVDAEHSNQVAAYVDFTANLPTGATLLAFWSDPDMVFQYAYDGLSIVYGTGMLDMALLTELAAADSSVCFHAIICIGKELCVHTFCIKASVLLRLVYRYVNTDKGAKGMAGTAEDKLHIVPNPTTGETAITGVPGVIEEITVIDMQGRAVAIFTTTDMIDTAGLPAGMYIVQVKSRATANSQVRVDYMRLLKR